MLKLVFRFYLITDEKIMVKKIIIQASLSSITQS
jgi:hypothetical protein